MVDEKVLCVAITPVGENARLILRADKDLQALGEAIAVEFDGAENDDGNRTLTCSPLYLTENELDELPEFEGW